MKKNRILALVLALLMVLTPMGNVSFAEETKPTIDVTYKVDSEKGHIVFDGGSAPSITKTIEFKEGDDLEKAVKENAPTVKAKEGHRFTNEWSKVEDAEYTYQAKIEEVETVDVKYTIDKEFGSIIDGDKKVNEKTIKVELPKGDSLTDDLANLKAPKAEAKLGYKLNEKWEKVKDEENHYKLEATKQDSIKVNYEVDLDYGHFVTSNGGITNKITVEAPYGTTIDKDFHKKEAPKVHPKEGYAVVGDWEKVTGKDNTFTVKIEKATYKEIEYKVDFDKAYIDINGSKTSSVTIKLDKEEILTDKLVKEKAPKVVARTGYKFTDEWTKVKDNSYQAKVEKLETKELTYTLDKDKAYFKDQAGNEVDKLIVVLDKDTELTDENIKKFAPEVFPKPGYRVVGDWEKVEGKVNTYTIKVDKIEGQKVVFQIDKNKGYFLVDDKEVYEVVDYVVKGLEIDDTIISYIAPEVKTRDGYRVVGDWVKVAGKGHTYTIELEAYTTKDLIYTVDFDKAYFDVNGKKVNTIVRKVDSSVVITDEVVSSLAPMPIARKGYEVVGDWMKVEGKDRVYTVNVEEIDNTVVRYSLGVNIRDLKDVQVGYLDRGKKVEGKITGSYLYFNLDNKKVRVHTSFLSAEEPSLKLYTVGNSNIRESQSLQSDKVGYVKKGTVLYGYNRGTWTEVIYNGERAYIASNRLSRNPVEKRYVSKGVNIRDSKNNILGYYKAGQEFEGLESGKYIKFIYNKKMATVYRGFVREF